MKELEQRLNKAFHNCISTKGKDSVVGNNRRTDKTDAIKAMKWVEA